ncbi:putative NRPS-like protein biosynthetic cluster [Cytospora paraplurivora]|uniref:NRPS-like protein biosynthetic cluster n=1 Tax=Cytospora paraplurivora TaxID=2898453 RepID=A0AAN9YEJ5_9PEZI
MFGAIKVGYKMLFLSPRNSIEGQINVLNGVECRIFLNGEGIDVEDIRRRRIMANAVVPELAELLDDSIQVPIYPYTKTFEQAKMDPCLVLHTTGSTGLPKPIVWKNGVLSTYEAWRTIPHTDGYVPTTEIYSRATRAYTSMPLFHTSGLNAGITWALLLGVTLVYGAPQVVPNSAYVDEMHIHASVDASMGAPSIYEELSRDEDAVSRISRLEYVIASGAPLSQMAGNIFSKHTRVISNLGSTETACLQRLAPSIEDWSYFYWHPTHSGIEMREYLPGMYELFLVRNRDIELYQGVFMNFPSISEWSMSDLYERHPDPNKPFLYRYLGRKDDVIVLSNGEKVSPALMEAALMSSPLVKSAMVVGRGKFQPAVLIELKNKPPKSVIERQETVHKLMPFLDEANTHAPAHGKLDQYHILFADPKRPVRYLGQGKIQRVQTYTLYEPDIEHLYRSVEDSEDYIMVMENRPRLDLASLDAVKDWLRDLMVDIIGVHVTEDSQDLFKSGVDSLHVIRMAREVKFQAKRQGLGAGLEMFSPKDVYAHPTLNDLASRILNYAGSPRRLPGRSQEVGPDTAAQSSDNDAQLLLKRYTKKLPKSSTRTSKLPPERNITVLLTGSTGSLGSYILDALYRDKNVARVICLNRSSSAEERHLQNSVQRGLTSISGSWVDFIKADLSLPRMGLERIQYSQLLNTVTHIIHNQWPVNFNWTVASFEPHIQGVSNLINFSHESKHNAFILFVSSVSAVGSWNGPGLAPEEVIEDLSVAAPMGYGKSKLVSECLLAEAAKIIISSAYLGVLPATFPSRDRVDWLPVDKVSSILIEVLLACSTKKGPEQVPSAKVFHVVNHNVTSWSSHLMPAVAASYSPGSVGVKLVPFDTWLETLKQSADSSTLNVEKNPAVRLLDFYVGVSGADKIPRAMSSKKTLHISETLRNVGPVSEEWVRKWMSQWRV